MSGLEINGGEIEMKLQTETVYEKLIKDYNKDLDDAGINGERLAQRLDEISQIGAAEGGGVTRIGYSEEEKQAKELVIGWMKEAGLEVTVDGAGNVFGRFEGAGEGPAVMSGSHLDTVPNGGNFDGVLGVLAALEVVETWKATGYVPPLPYEVAIFSDEEGSRFKAGLTGSQAFMGKWTDEKLDQLADIKGDNFDQVIERYGSDRASYLQPSSEGKNVGLFVEVHIEQGTVLEAHDQPVGVVNGIAGPAWLEVTFTGKAGHAGSTPMENRKDPVVAAGIFIQEVETLPRNVSQTAVATVGKLNVLPNGTNVIAQEVKLMVDIRDIDEEQRDSLVRLVSEAAERTAENRGIEVAWSLEYNAAPLPIREDMQAKLAGVLEKLDIKPVYIPSGAAHDTMILGEKIQVAMIFARSKNGISHNPEEWTTLDDCVQSVRVLKGFVEEMMAEQGK